MGARAHTHIRDWFIGDRHLLRHADLFDTLNGGLQPAQNASVIDPLIVAEYVMQAPNTDCR
jgi:hypothetical protein